MSQKGKPEPNTKQIESKNCNIHYNEDTYREIYLTAMKVFILLSDNLINPSEEVGKVFLLVKQFLNNEAQFIDSGNSSLPFL